MCNKSCVLKSHVSNTVLQFCFLIVFDYCVFLVFCSSDVLSDSLDYFREMCLLLQDRGRRGRERREEVGRKGGEGEEGKSGEEGRKRGGREEKRFPDFLKISQTSRFEEMYRIWKRKHLFCLNFVDLPDFLDNRTRSWILSELRSFQTFLRFSRPYGFSSDFPEFPEISAFRRCCGFL